MNDLQTTLPAGIEAFLTGGGEMGERIRVFDWASTPLGPIEGWSPALRALVAFIVHCPVPLVMLWGEDGIMIYNDGYSQFAGDNHPRILGCRVREAWPEVADFNDNVMRVGLAGGTLAYKNHLLRLNRTGAFEDVWMNLDYSPVYDDSGEPAGVLAIVVETTEAVNADQAVRESEARLQFLDRLGKRTAASTDADEILTVTTCMAGEALGVSACAYADVNEEKDGVTVRGAWAPEGMSSIVGEYRLSGFGDDAVRDLRGGRALIVNDVALWGGGGKAGLPGVATGAAMCIPLVKEGRLTAFIMVHRAAPHEWTAAEAAMMRDVAERSWAHIERVRIEAELRDTAAGLRDFNESLERRVRRRSAALERSETQFRLLVQGVTDYAIFMLDPHGNVSTWNAGAERIKGYAPDEIIGRHFSTFYPDEERIRGDADRALETARREGRFAAEGWRRRKDGTRFRANVVIDAIHDDDGELIGFAKITRDITERDETQRQLEQAREALLQSQKLEAIGQLTGGVAHDFNNLLMAILSGLELVRKRVPDDPAIARLLDNCVQAAERGAALTHRMLAFARRQELKVECVDLAQLVAGMTELLQRTLDPALTIKTHFAPNLPPISADVNQLEMALLNLAVNARDAMPDGGELSISATESELQRGDDDLAPGRYVCLTVRDDGIGMDAETLRRATDPFFTTKGVGKGTGLGLSMVHGFARQSGGALRIESEIGKGTSTHIWLPAAAHPIDRREASQPDEAPSCDDRPLSVLVVDDDAIILMNTAAMLEDLGHDAVEAASADEALAHLEKQPHIDLLITDQAMPGMTGSDLVRKARERHPNLPVILATGYGETPVDDNVAIHRLGKPFSQADLQKAISTAVAES